MLAPILALAMMPKPDLQTGAALYAACRAAMRLEDDPQHSSDEDVEASTDCTTYISGFVDASSVNPSFCLDSTVRMVTYARLYVAYMQEHPKELDRGRAQTFYNSLRVNYACSVRK